MIDAHSGAMVYGDEVGKRVSAEQVLPPRASSLPSVRPLRFEEVSRGAKSRWWNELVRRHHYLGYRTLVGMHLKYLIFSADGELLAATGWNSSVWKLRARDVAIGWSTPERQRLLGSVANNSRFVIFPWVSIPHLASHLLALQVRHVREDWERLFGVRLELLETFVDPSRFRGTSYRAANWIFVGRTKGYARTRDWFSYHGQRKEVYLYPLSRDVSEALGLRHRPEIAIDHQYPQSLALMEQRRAHMDLIKARWNQKLAPSFEMDEKDLSEMADAFGAYHLLFRDCFGRVEHEAHSRAYLQGLLSALERKSMEPIALSLLDESRVKALQKFIGAGVWDAEKLGRRHREEAARVVSAPDGVWSVDGSDFPKKGTESVGVARQYCGRLGKVDNCQAGVFVAYASSKGHALLNRRLFLPERWFDEEHRERWKKCRIPEGTTFKTKPELALEMILQLRQEGLFEVKWVTGDDFFGRNSTFRDGLPDDLWYLLDVPCDTRVWKQRPQTHVPPSRRGRPRTRARLKRGEPKSIPVSTLANDPSVHWQIATVADGAKGEIRARIARMRVVASCNGLPGEELWLFLRQSLTDGHIRYAISNAPADVPLREMTRVSSLRWPIEQCLQEGKGEIGMDHYEHRSWNAWHRHMTFVFVAQLFLLMMQQRFKKKSGVDVATNGVAHEDRPSLADISEGRNSRDSAVSPETQLDRQMLPCQITALSI